MVKKVVLTTEYMHIRLSLLASPVFPSTALITEMT